ncbi:MAG: hypothetical protein WA510_18705 [Acidobacteriaceae bacterium]
MKDGVLIFTLCAALVAGVTGCKVEVNKSHDGGSDNVKIATPFGGIAVNQDQASAAELGLPAYPGAVQDQSGENSKSAKIDMDFGAFRMRVKVADYRSQDSQDEVMAFYRKALDRYGEVIECVGGKPVGSPTVTPEGLTCDSSGHEHGAHKPDQVELKAGSKHHQHMVIFHDRSSSSTHFTLLALDLPHGFDIEQKGTN